MNIGVPKEIKDNEQRVSLTPYGAAELSKQNHTVLIEKSAGLGSGFSDNKYIESVSITSSEQCLKYLNTLSKTQFSWGDLSIKKRINIINILS